MQICTLLNIRASNRFWTVNEKIIAVEDEISADLPGLEVIDLNGAIVTPVLSTNTFT